MKKHISRALALVLVLAMVLTLLPMAAFAAAGSGTAIDGIPADGQYAVIFAISDKVAFGADISGGNAAAKAASLSEEGVLTVNNGTAAIKFIKNTDDTYYMTIGGKYLVCKDVGASKEQLVLCDTTETGAKWSIVADQAGLAGAYNIKNAEYKYNGKDVYMEYYGSKGFCMWSYSSTNAAIFQFSFFAVPEDTDGYMGTIPVAAALPANGDKVVIYNAYAKAVMGQPAADAAAPCLSPATANLVDGTLRYEDIGNGALIFDVTIGTDGLYTFKTGDTYLACPENTTAEDGSTMNDETILLVDAESDYTKWSVEPITGGYCMYNKTAKYKTSRVCIEYFNEVFSGWSFSASNVDYYAMNFYKVEDKFDTGYVINPSIVFEEGLTAATGSDCLIKFTVDDLEGVKTISAKYGLDAAASKAATLTNEGLVYSFTVPAAELTGHSKLNLLVEMTNNVDASCKGELKLDIVDEPLILSVTPEPSAATGTEKKPAISATYANAGTNPTIAMLLDGTAVKPTVTATTITYTPAANLPDGKHTVELTITRTDSKKVEKAWSFFVGEGGLSLYYGQIHSHTAEYSDGAGTLEQAYEYAHGADDVDFLIVTDHSNYFDTTKTATTDSINDAASASLLKTADGTQTKWQEARATAAHYNELYDDMICAYGYEMTWSGGPGHTNSFNTAGIVSRNNSVLNNKTNYAGMFAYNDLISTANAEGKAYIEGAPIISQFNHPGTTFGNFGNYAGYTSSRDATLNLIEVGNGEGAVGGSSYWPSYSEYDLCLSMGWHVAPTNNQDNHKGKWGDSNTCRDVIITDDFTEAGLYNALSARHVYATEDQNLQIMYYLDAAGKTYLQGDIAPLSSDEQPTQVSIDCSIYDPNGEGLGKVQIIGEGGKVLAEQAISGSTYNLKKTIANDNAYYYIKVIQADGDIAVTAPVWVSESIPVNVAVKSDAAVSVVGTEETITGTVTNGSESESITVTKYTMMIDNKVVATETSEEVLAPGASKDITYAYTPATAGNHIIKMFFQFTYMGKSQVFSKTITQKSLDGKDVIYIGIDKGHTNFYVSGDYAGNESTFIQLCADNGFICEYIEAGEMTKENLAKYKLVALTVPLVNATTQPTNWTADERAAVAEYAKAGGNILMLSSSDRKDYVTPEGDKDTWSSAKMCNDMLDAIGAKTNFAQGIVVDNDMKTNEAYRVNFNGPELLDADHPFTAGIFQASNGQYQFYNGTSVIVKEGFEKDVTTLVKGYDSTWVANYKDNFTGSSYVPDYSKDTKVVEMGKVNLVTYEKLSGGGFLVCGGACFISSYDLKTDTAASEQYENYSMVMNILEYVKNPNVGTITPIANVHKGSEKQQFTIEGWVTSNASGYDVDTAFFDCIYVQDATRGINLFPVAGNYKIGQKVRAHGGVTYYCGEVELNLSPDYNGSIKIISNELNVIAPKNVTCKEAMADNNIGNLMRVVGIVSKIHKTEGVIDYIYVNDNSGTEGVVFINGYIQKEYKGLDNLEVGMAVDAIGIGSRDVDETDTTGTKFIRRLRVRDRTEVVAYNDPCKEYTDIQRNAWYHTAVDYVIENKYMGSVSTVVKAFGPNIALSRAMVVTVLYNISGTPAVDITTEFSDVKANDWFAKSVSWAAANKITSGTGDGKFNPNKNVTREEIATFIKNFAAFEDYSVNDRTDISSFVDANTVSSWATDAMQWAVDFGVISGKATQGKILLAPKANALRSEFASIIMRFQQNKLNLDNKNDLVILYTNDVHCGVDYSATSFGYAGLARYKKDMEAIHDEVGLIDSGDAIQGEAIGTLSKGALLTKLMNQVGYEYATLGNHEFDYGMDELKARIAESKFEYLSCNFNYTGEDTENAINPKSYAIADYGDFKVGYIGISTPETLTKSTPTYFQDEEGNWVYNFCNDETGAALYNAVQAAVEAAQKDGAQYIVAISHLGVDEVSAPWRSSDVIANTAGIDVVLDGHSHSTIACEIVKDADDNDVLLTSTGTKLANIGKLTIRADGSMKTELISRDSVKSYDKQDEAGKLTEGYWDDATLQAVKDIEAENAKLLDEVVATVENDLVVNDPTDGKTRLIRKQETNLGDVCADAYRTVLGADIAFVNGGGIRADIKAGDVTYGDVIAVHPFGNMACLVEATGQQIVDALECSSRAVTIKDGVIDGELGGFLQVAGIKYTIYTKTASTVKLDSAAMFQSITGARRVGDVQVLNKTSGEYEPIDITKTYTLASHNYMLKSGGDGLNMFMKNKVLQDEVKIDNQVLIEYMCSEAFEEHDYNNWKGEGRITIIDAEAPTAPTPPTPVGEGFALATELKTGDEVVIYNAGNGMALSSTKSGYYLAGIAATVTNNEIAMADATAIWTVTKNSDNSYTFTQGEMTLLAGPSGSYFNLFTTGEYAGGWNIEVGNADTKSYYVTSSTLTGSYGKVYLEWYAKNTAFSAYCTSTDRVTEKDFGFQFFVKTAD